MNFKILILLLFFPFVAISNELDISKMTNEEIIKENDLYKKYEILNSYTKNINEN